MPDSLTAPFSVAAEPGDRINLIGVIRDFSGSHSDFEARPPEGFGQTAGNVDLVLSDDGRPVFLGNEPRTVAMTEDRDLVSYWPFDEGTGTTTKDLGADNDGELQGGATWVDGRVGGAIHFDGVNDVVNVKDAPEIRVTGDVTFSGWFKLDVNHNGGSAKTQIITEKYLHNNTGFHLALIGRDYGRREVTDGSMVFKVEHERSVRYKWTNRSAWQKGEWYHFAAVLDASDSRNNRLIINGEDDTATADAGPGNGGSLALNTNYAADLRIGGKKLDQNMGVGGLLYFQGAIDDFMVFSRVVTEEELSAAMNAGYQVTRNWTDRFSNNIAPHMYRDSDAGMPNCVVVSDRVGTAGNASDAGISSGDSFDQWFSDAMGVNLSSFHRITMVAHDSGEYRFTDEQFYPIDGTLLGNEGDSHNHNFTYHVQAIFTYDRCGNDSTVSDSPTARSTRSICSTPSVTRANRSSI
jgi:hypothetical protein